MPPSPSTPIPRDPSAARTEPAEPLVVVVDGIGFWAPTLPGWPAARAAFGEGRRGLASPSVRPEPTRVAPNERRRAPDAVAIAIAVADEAVRASGRDAAALPSVFTSAHGDLATVDALCRTLADDPLHLSPTRFHHSVHNAASGYWSIAVGATAASTALSAHRCSFAAGLLEAAAIAVAEATPVLVVGVDTEAPGALASLQDSRGMLGCALVLAPTSGSTSVARLTLSLHPGPATGVADHRPDAGDALAANALADVLPLARALARVAADRGADRASVPIRFDLPLHGDLQLALSVEPAQRA
jgi:hypothetical protein